MNILAPVSTCPNCGTPPTSSDARADERQPYVLTASYLCGEGHIWSTRWLVGAA